MLTCRRNIYSVRTLVSDFLLGKGFFPTDKFMMSDILVTNMILTGLLFLFIIFPLLLR